MVAVSVAVRAPGGGSDRVNDSASSEGWTQPTRAGRTWPRPRWTTPP